MPTIIDSLLVKLRLDTGDYDKSKAKVDKGLKETDGNFEKVTKQAAKFLAVIGGAAAVKHFVSDMIETNAALERFSLNIKRSVEDVSAWQNATELAGGSAEGLRGTMDMLSKSQTELQLTGQSSLIPYFSALGIAIADVNGKARPVDAMLLDLADRFGNMDRATANNMGRMMGIDQGTMNLLLKGRKEVELMIARQKEYGAVTKKQAEESSKMREQIWRMKQEFAAFGRELLSRAMPYLEKLFGLIEDFGQWIRGNKEFVTDFLTVLAVGLGGVALAVTPINLTALAVTGLAAAIALLWQDYQTWKRGGDALMPWDVWAPRIEKAIGLIKRLKDFIADALFRSIAVGDWTLKMATGDWKGAQIAAKAALEGMPKDNPSAAAPSAGSTAGRLSALEKKYGLPAGILDRMWLAESSRGKRMLSPAGAKGHFGFMDGTAKQYGVTDPNDFNQSSDGAARYLRDLIAHYGGDVNKAVAAYNWGPGNVDRKGMGRAPAETRGYLGKVLGIPGASAAASGVASARAAGAGNRTSTTTIGEIHVHTKATDAHGIARDIAAALDSTFTTQANSGMVA